MIQKVLLVENELGLHARAAAKLVKLTSNFSSDIKISKLDSDQRIDAKSILGVLLLAASQGTELRFTFIGDDEEQAEASVRGLFKDRFGEQK